jgi:flagellar motility protein MotE (MotC chaperone)
MGETRRRFLMILAAAASCSAAADVSAFAQVRKSNPFPSPPASAETQNPAEAAAAKTDPQSTKRVALQQNEKEFRAEVDRLYQLAGELKQEVDKTVTTEVFSVQMYRRTEEIEKVAKMLKGKAKG